MYEGSLRDLSVKEEDKRATMRMNEAARVKYRAVHPPFFSLSLSLSQNFHWVSDLV